MAVRLQPKLCTTNNPPVLLAVVFLTHDLVIAVACRSTRSRTSVIGLQIAARHRPATEGQTREMRERPPESSVIGVFGLHTMDTDEKTLRDTFVRFPSLAQYVSVAVFPQQHHVPTPRRRG